MLKSSLCDCSDIPIKGNIASTEANDTAKPLGERQKGVMLKNCVPFTGCISETNNTQVDNVKDVDVAMLIYNLIEHSGNYSKTSRMWQYYRDELIDILVDSESLKSQMKITGKTPAPGNTKDVEITGPLKYLNNFWRTFEMLLNNCEINLVLTQSVGCIISFATWGTKFAITDAKLNIPVVTFLLAQGNENYYNN